MPIFKFDGSKLMFLHLITNKSFELKRFKLTITTFLRGHHRKQEQ